MPARVVDDDAIGDGLHDVLALAHLPPRVLGEQLVAVEETRVLNSQPDLQRELLQQLDFLGGQTAHAPVIDLDGSENGPARVGFSLRPWLKNWHAQDGAWPASDAIVVEQGEFDLRVQVRVWNNQRAARLYDLAEEDVFPKLWIPCLRAEVQPLLRRDRDTRQFAHMRVGCLRMLVTRKRCFQQENGAACRADEVLYRLEHMVEHLLQRGSPGDGRGDIVNSVDVHPRAHSFGNILDGHEQDAPRRLLGGRRAGSAGRVVQLAEQIGSEVFPLGRHNSNVPVGAPARFQEAFVGNIIEMARY